MLCEKAWLTAGIQILPDAVRKKDKTKQKLKTIMRQNKKTIRIKNRNHEKIGILIENFLC